jgi:para-nitrobenzyl esterase
VPRDFAWRWSVQVALAALMAGCFQAHAQNAGMACPTEVVTERGPVVGTLVNDVLEFKGIPYAAPPIGELRWEPPRPVQPWKDALDATRYRSACAQLERYGIPESSEDEDCLYLNVTVPAPGGRPVREKLPVIVWIHGGGFIGGSSGLYDLSEMARVGKVVVVSMNYRLGVFGFMPHARFDPAFNGAYGLEDQRAALRWVRSNIEKFGGDKDKVTLMGEYAGAHGVCMHLLAPERTAGLFHRAIIQSGGCAYKLRHHTEGAEKIGKRVAELVGCTGDDALKCLREKSVKELLDAGQKAAASDLMGYTPTWGTQAVPHQSDMALATGQFVKVPMIHGGNHDELRLYIAYELIGGKLTTRDNFKKRVEETYGDQADRVRERYPLLPDLSAASRLGTLWTDFHPNNGLNVCLFLRAAQLASRYVKVYQYEFADPHAPDVVENPGIQMGAVHSAELPYQFPRFSNTLKRDGPRLEEPQRTLARTMMEYWTRFAHTGTPSADGAPAWEPFETEKDVLRLEPGNIGPFSMDAEHHCDFWRRLYPGLLDNNYNHEGR